MNNSLPYPFGHTFEIKAKPCADLKDRFEDALKDFKSAQGLLDCEYKENLNTLAEEQGVLAKRMICGKWLVDDLEKDEQ